MRVTKRVREDAEKLEAADAPAGSRRRLNMRVMKEEALEALEDLELGARYRQQTPEKTSLRWSDAGRSAVPAVAFAAVLGFGLAQLGTAMLGSSLVQVFLTFFTIAFFGGWWLKGRRRPNPERPASARQRRGHRPRRTGSPHRRIPNDAGTVARQDWRPPCARRADDE